MNYKDSHRNLAEMETVKEFFWVFNNSLFCPLCMFMYLKTTVAQNIRTDLTDQGIQ